MNRMFHMTKQGIQYEADPRHAELLAKALGLDGGAKHAVTPGPRCRMAKQASLGTALMTLSCPARKSRRGPSMPLSLATKNSFKFQPMPDTMSITRGTSSSPGLLARDRFRKHGYVVFTGLPKLVVAERKAHLVQPQSWQARSGSSRYAVLRRVHVQGPAWEKPSSELIAATAKTTKYKKARLGSKADKRAELMLDTSDQFTSSLATKLRALAARRNGLGMDRPDGCYASKELCECCAQPSRAAVDALKRVVRYVIGNRQIGMEIRFPIGRGPCVYLCKHGIREPLGHTPLYLRWSGHATRASHRAMVVDPLKPLPRQKQSSAASARARR